MQCWGPAHSAQSQSAWRVRFPQKTKTQPTHRNTTLHFHVSQGLSSFLKRPFDNLFINVKRLKEIKKKWMLIDLRAKLVTTPCERVGCKESVLVKD
jgi:hypothetical protein